MWVTQVFLIWKTNLFRERPVFGPFSDSDISFIIKSSSLWLFRVYEGGF